MSFGSEALIIRLNSRLQRLASCPAGTIKSGRGREGKRERERQSEQAGEGGPKCGGFVGQGSACWSCIAPQLEWQLENLSAFLTCNLDDGLVESVESL